jgi:hypothetical protein
MIRSHLAAAALVGLLASTGVAAAQGRIAAGVLECRAGASTSFIIGSIRDFDCLFTPISGPLQRYGATIQRLGVDLGWSGSTVMIWNVFAPTDIVGPGSLSGTYGGISAGAAIGVGLGANALAGGFDNSFALQPLSFEGQTGLNAFAGISSLELRARY